MIGFGRDRLECFLTANLDWCKGSSRRGDDGLLGLLGLVGEAPYGLIGASGTVNFSGDKAESWGDTMLISGQPVS